MLSSSSPQLRIPVFPFLFLAAAVVVQSLLYRRTIAWIDRNAGESLRVPLRRSAKIAFVVLNAPWLGMPVWWLGYDARPWPIVGTLLDVSVEYLAVPSAVFLIWQFSCTALVGLYVGLDVIALAWRRIAARFRRRSSENAAETVSPEPSAESPAREPSGVIGRREFVQAASLALTASPFVVSSYGAYVARESFRVERVVLTYPGLPPELRGLTIVQLTDIHAGVFMDHRRMMEFVGAANRLDPDLMVLTGDFVANSSRYVPLFIGAFKHLRARCGVFATLGNHDLFTNSATALLEALRRFNIRLLVNEQEFLSIRGARLNLMGITYIPQSRHERLADLTFDNAMRSLRVEGATILLSHQPNVFPQAAALDIPLTISGHTHGGQVKFEFLGYDIAPSILMSPFTAGLYSTGQAQLYVGRGVGTTGPPIRLGSVPEIAHITLI